MRRPPQRALIVRAAALVVAVAAVVTIRIFRRRRRRGGAAVGRSRHLALPPRPDGEGVVFVVNARAGTSGGPVAQELRHRLPAAVIVDLEDPVELPATLEREVARGGVEVLGVAGGDGSASAAAEVAAAHGLPLALIPAGTLNHLARDLGVASIDDAVRAVRAGTAVEVDLATIDGRLFLNTASFGSYSELVDLRERLEDRIGKWPAHLISMAVVLRRGQPVAVQVDGVRRSLWMVFIGNCSYEPDGFAPTRRRRLDDGLLDVRVVDASRPWYRTRLILGLVTGRLGRSPMYDQWSATTLLVRADEPMRLAADGETFDGSAEVVVGKDGRRLAVYA